MKYTLRRSRSSETLFGVPFWSLGVDLVGIVQVGLESVTCVQGQGAHEVAERHLPLSVLFGTEPEVWTWSLQTVLTSKFPYL